MSDPTLLAVLALSQGAASEALPPQFVEPTTPTVSQPQAERSPQVQPAAASALPTTQARFEVQPDIAPTATEFSYTVRPTSGTQLYAQRLAALRSGRLYTRLPVNSYQSIWQKATRQPTYQQWRQLLALEARAVAGGQGNNRLSVMVGDSLSMWFPSDRLPSNHLWLNQGISGDTTWGILQRLNTFANTRPNTIYLMAGVNDLKMGYTDAQIIGNMQKILTRLRQMHPQAQIVVQSILPTRTPRIPNARITNLNQTLQRLSDRYQATYLDLYSQMVDYDGFMQAGLTTDGLHLNARGYETWEWQLRQVETLVARR